MPETALDVVERRAASIAKAPRITKQFIETNIVETLYATGDAFVAAADGPDDHQELYAHFTLCIIRVANGFIVVGRSAPMNPENFNAELGRQLSYEDAFRQLWGLYAFAKMEDELLYGEDEGPNPHDDGETNSAAPPLSKPPEA